MLSCFLVLIGFKIDCLIVSNSEASTACKSKTYFTSCVCLHRYCLRDFMHSRVLFMSYTVMAARVDKIGFYLANCLREIRRFAKADRVIFVTSRRNQGSHFQYIPPAHGDHSHIPEILSLHVGHAVRWIPAPPEFPLRVIELRDRTGNDNRNWYCVRRQERKKNRYSIERKSDLFR